MKRTFSAMIVALLGVMSCAKLDAPAERSKQTDTVSTSTAPPASASIAPIDQVPVPPSPTATTSPVITTPTPTPTSVTEGAKPAEKPVAKPVMPAPVTVEPTARAKPIQGGANDPQKKPGPIPVGTSQAGRVVRFSCPNGEVPSQVMGGCMCGSEIANPCGPGVRVPDLRVEGKTCLFTCP
jgi:hypothetical protein